ncbi:hypothetical protein FOA52_001043 [Chlamydomonas sp. UWO 241]|nr:hypothetical protein FOA52_001043 [Chlamydomonas sp. UWO 241]
MLPLARAMRLASPLLAPLAGRRMAVSVSAEQAGGKGKGKGKKAKDDEGGPYSKTVQLPITGFNMRADSAKREPEIQSFWAESQTYEALSQRNPGAPFTLHDGPPYANGDLHIGHALNKVLKDFINRYQLLQGRRARFVPGWDTHGLPIELKVLQGLPQSERRDLSVAGLRAKAKEFALKTVDSQRKQFKRYGVWGDWDTPYITLQPEYEAAQLEVFGKMFLNGHIYRGRKPVHWSPSSRTALAEAELEYPEGHKSTSIYVQLPLVKTGPKVPAELAPHLEGAAVAVWTTTPWTIPANLAVGVNERLEYCVVQASGDAASSWKCSKLLVAIALVDTLAQKTGAAMEVLCTFTGAQLEGCLYKHPLFDRESPIVIGGEYITTDAGTGLVHTAPGHGQEDYLVGQRYGLELLSPVDDAGNFTEEAGQFAGMNVQGDGNKAVVAALAESGALLKEELYEHKYPYDWRTKKPTIFRATSQWFASVEGFRAAALEQIRGAVSWVPASGINRITGMTEGRSDWCISRQRKWGVPIPVFYHIESGEPLLDAATLAHATAIVREHGTDAWFNLPIKELLPECHKDKAATHRKGEDTMDVWFDSGSSWAGVLQARKDSGLTYPADLYLEGSDQHRGWFQSSLLTSVAANGIAPYKQVLTHGFVLDEKGTKMSKSLGNVVDPSIVIDGGKDQKKDPAYGADVLRLWVASSDYSSDIMIGPGILKQTAEVYRKIRGTLRFLIGNLHDYDPSKDAVPYEQLPQLDRYMLSRLASVTTEAKGYYETYQFSKIFQVLQRFVAAELSSFYLDAAKDRLYIRGADDAARRSCQTVLDHVLRSLLSVTAPVAPHLAEDAWLNLPYARPADSVFQAGWTHAPEQWSTGLSQEDLALWAAVIELREAVNGTLEKARNEKAVGSSLDARVTLHVADAELAARLQALNASENGVDELRYLFIVSQTDLVPDAATVRLAPFSETFSAPAADASALAPAGAVGEFTVGVSRAAGAKCARCWNYCASVGAGAGADAHPELCERCATVIAGLGFTLPAAAGGKEAVAA